MSGIEIAANARPLVILNLSEPGKRANLGRNVPKSWGPPRERQRARLTPRFEALSSAMSRETLKVVGSLTGTDPELTVVFDVHTQIQNFEEVAAKVAGLNFLVETETDPAAADFGFSTDNKNGEVPRSLYVCAPNREAINQILRLWEKWSSGSDESLGYGFSAWKSLFSMLRDVHMWSPEDRVTDPNLISTWREALDSGAGTLIAEVELWYRNSERRRASADLTLSQSIEAAGARVLDRAILPEINYHALLVEVPSALALATLNANGFLAENRAVAYIRSQMVAADSSPTPDPLPPGDSERSGVDNSAPIVGLLDGMPLIGHRRLKGRVTVYDPAGLGGRTPVEDRHHGTAMASLVLHGDLNASDRSLSRPIYLYPVFTETTVIDGIRRDSLPKGRLSISVFREALEHVVTNPDTRSIRVILIAAGHTSAPFANQVSPLGRLLDHYAHKHSILFIVPSGNYDAAQRFDRSLAADKITAGSEEQRRARHELFANSHLRRILSPSDSMNALTIGALHRDSDPRPISVNAIDIVGPGYFPSPTSAVGGGFRRQIKPEIFADGGRVLYRDRWTDTATTTLDVIRSGSASLGLRVAAPGLPGELDDEQATAGTSAASALVAHEAAAVAEALLDPGQSPLVDHRYVAVSTKALLVNSASWQDAEKDLTAQSLSAKRGEIRGVASRLLGYGSVQRERIATCSDERFTALAVGEVLPDQSRLLKIPLPKSLSGQRIWRRASFTLAWMSPTNSSHQLYRRAKLWFTMPGLEAAGLSRSQADWRAVQRGSLQHEVLEGDDAIVVDDSSDLSVMVHFATSAGGFSSPVRFALAATFEVEEGSGIPVYAEIVSELAARAAVRGTRLRA